MRYLVATVLIPFNGSAAPFYIVVERITNVAHDWKIRLGTDDRDLANRECARLNAGNGGDHDDE